jgi:hypothetical protein
MALNLMTGEEMKKRHSVRGTKPSEQEPTTLEGYTKDKGSAALKAENAKLKSEIAALKAEIKKLEK